MLFSVLYAFARMVEFTVRQPFASINILWCIMFVPPHLGRRQMTSDLDRKTYWDLMETVCWISARDEQRVAALRDLSDQEKMALVLGR